MRKRKVPDRHGPGRRTKAVMASAAARIPVSRRGMPRKPPEASYIIPETVEAKDAGSMFMLMMD